MLNEKLEKGRRLQFCTVYIVVAEKTTPITVSKVKIST